MTVRVLQIAMLVLGLGVLVALALSGASRRVVSVYSTYDTGPNGYAALYHVLVREGVPVARLRGPFDLRDPRTRVLAFSSTVPDAVAGGGAHYDATDIKRFVRFAHAGGSFVYFGDRADAIVKRMHKAHLRVRVLDARAVSNGALARRPQAIVSAYRALAGKGVVLFDERLHGYNDHTLMWSVLPGAVRAAAWLACFALLLVLVDANVRAAPAIVREPPADRDSTAYVSSMAVLLRRARARRSAIARFASMTPQSDELRRLAELPHPRDPALVRAAQLYFDRRKDRS